jgi:ferric-chelate reductase
VRVGPLLSFIITFQIMMPAGFLSVAQLPVVFLFSTKNSIVSFLLGPGVGYEKLNFLHRWSGRVMFLSALIHGALWIRSLVEDGMPILGQKKETTGIIAFSFLALIVLVSLRPIRKYFYQAFFNLQWVLSFFSFPKVFTPCFPVLCLPWPSMWPFFSILLTPSHGFTLL